MSGRSTWVAYLALGLLFVPASQGQNTRPLTAPLRFAERAELLVQAAPVDKGEWGLLVVDAASGEILYQKNADKYFVPASNMKLLTTALALDTLGSGYRFRTTLDTNGVLLPNGRLSGDLILVGRGDPNISNRKFPFDTKEEFDGPPEKGPAELGGGGGGQGLKGDRGDVWGEDRFFPGEPPPGGWENDEIVWE